MSAGRQRFSIIPAAAVTDPRLEPRDLQILCLLGRHTDRRGWCCRSQVKMAREVACGRSTVQRSLARLISAGYVEQRANTRESNADAAHDYRVVLDTPDDADEAVEPTEKGGAHKRAPLPTSGHPCPPMDGNPLPTHERAPMLTTPLNDTERDAGAREFEKAFASWPTSATDSKTDAKRAWRALSIDERAAAAANVGRVVAVYKSFNRKFLCSFGTYLTERKWLALPELPQASAEAVARRPAAPPPTPPKTKFLAAWEARQR